MQIELRNVSKHFGRLHALRDVSLTIPAGRRVALIGPNGSGKSTLTRAIMGLLECSGDVLLDGRPAASDRRALADRMAYVPQIAPHFGAPVAELIRAVAGVRGLDPVRIERIVRPLGLELSSINRQPFRNLSGGMKQKLLIALALAANASLLIMDEPTASLDATARERFFELVGELAPDATLLLCSHRWEELRHLVDHVVALEDGRVVYDGSSAQYLDGRVMSVIEVRLAGPQVPWLLEEGFRAGREGWWVRMVTHAEKLRLVPRVSAELGPRLSNLMIRDLETIDVSSVAQGGDHVTSLD